MHVKVHHLLVVIHFMRKVSKECTAEGLFWRSLLQALRKPWKQLRQQSAIDVDDVEEDRADAATVAEPEMEVEHRQSEGEPEPDEEMLQDIPEYEEEVTQAMLDERRPLLLPGRAMVTDPDLMQARAAMQPIYCPEMKRGKCIDAKRPAVACMVYYMVRAMYNTNRGRRHRHGLQCHTSKCQKSFRKDVDMMSWETGLANCAKSIQRPRSAGTSPTRKFLNLPGRKQTQRTLRASTCSEGSERIKSCLLMGYFREAFNPKTYYDRDQETVHPERDHS